MAYQTIPASSSGSSASPTPPIALSSLETIASPRLLGLRSGGPGPMQALTPVDAAATIYTRGADLGDASVTIQPFVGVASSYYVMPAGTMTANRTITLGITSFATVFPTTGTILSLLRIARLDRTAFTLTVLRHDAVVLLVDIASPPVERELQFVCSNAGLWAASAIFPIRV